MNQKPDNDQPANCPKCGDFICDQCGSAHVIQTGADKVAQIATAKMTKAKRPNLLKLFTSGAVVLLTILACSAGLGAFAKLVYLLFSFGWGLL